MDFGPEFNIVKGLGQETVNPLVCGLNGGFHGCVSGENDTGYIRIEGPDHAQYFKAGQSRHFIIRDHRYNIEDIVFDKGDA